MLTLEQYRERVVKMIFWAKAYYKDGVPKITDQEWDLCYRSLSEFETANIDLIDPTSPVGKVGFAMFNETGNVKHNPPMLSLKNAMDVDEANVLIKNLTAAGPRVVELKADGIACRLHYKNGKYVQALTRGDGSYGEDITRHISPGTCNIPDTIKLTNDIMVDGELVIKYSDFKTLNDNRQSLGKEQYKNTRNAVAGMMSKDELDTLQKTAISFIAYELHGNSAVLTWNSNRYVLKDNGFELVTAFKDKNFETIVRKVIATRDELPYMIDGLVFKVDLYQMRDKLGTNNHSPKWAFSYKFPALTNKTILESVGFTVGRTGQITPMAYFKPVDIGGVTVSKSAIDSVDRWRTLQLSKGATLTVSRRADVRPYVESCESNGGELYPYTALCPWCNCKLTEKGKKIFCMNDYCQGRLIAHITYAVSDHALDIADLSEQKVTQLCSSGLIKSVTGLYHLTAEVLVNAGYTNYSAIKMIKEINSSKHNTMFKIITSFGIHLVGNTISKQIVEYLRTIKVYSVDEVIDTLSKPHMVNAMPIGVAAKESINTFFSTPYYLVRTELYKGVGFTIKTISGLLNGRSYCITGSLYAIPRSELEKRLLAAGAMIQSNVTKDTTALITDDYVLNTTPTSPSAKLQKALALGIKILSSDEVIKLLN